MKIFKLDRTYTIVCECVKTRNGFKHIAKMVQGSYIVAEAKVCYLNRTWEAYEYESVAESIIRDYFPKKDWVRMLTKLKKASLK